MNCGGCSGGDRGAIIGSGSGGNNNDDNSIGGGGNNVIGDSDIDGDESGGGDM